MNRVLGSSIKAAVATSVAKQIAAAGIVGARTTTRWSGKTAYAAWRMDDDSARYWHAVREAVINYPNLSDEALLTRAEADLIAAYTLHETGHVIYTKRVGLKGDLHHVWNGIEDGWMENKVIQAGQARNAKQLFTRLLNKVTYDCGTAFNPCQWSDAPFALAMLSRSALGNGNAFADSLIGRIPQPKRALYERVMEQVVNSDSSITNAEIAIEFAEAFKQIEEAKERVQAPPPPPPPAPSQPTDDYWQDDGEEEPKAEEAPIEDTEAIAEAEKPIQPDRDSDPFGGADDDLDDDDASDLDGDDVDPLDEEVIDVESGAGEEEADEEVGEEAAEEADAGGSYGSDEPANSASEFSDDEPNEEPVRSPEPSIDDVVNRAHKRTKDKVGLPHYSPANRIDSNSLGRSAGLVREFGPTPGALKTHLTRLLLSVDRIGWDVGATSGRFDVRRTSRMMAGSERVFKKRWETEAINSRVTVLVDMSDSMGFDGGERAALSSDVAYAIADVCERTSTKVEVVGFMSGSSGVGQAKLADMSGGAQKVAAGWSNSTLVEFKRFDQRVREGREAIFKSRYLHRGSTPDAHALRTCVEQMGIANEQRRIVIVLTDGFGDPDKVRQVCDVAHKRGCKVLGIGILTNPEAMALAYPINACASSLSELSTVALRGLIKQVEAR